MRVDFRKSFTRDLKKIRDNNLLQQVRAAIEEVEAAPNLNMISNLKQLKGEGEYFRIKIGNYRIGLKLENDTFIFIRFLHRKDIYRYFP
ncbi:type II toxin-antitoxin system RelE/ParE family toxin [candidate division KSB1 bacterium]|nr:type II toxin-antitoxin system RelE/ParE family toxin [candidate division KSB1 bacterium]